MLSPTLSKSLACCIVALLAASAPANATIFSASLNGTSENPVNEIIDEDASEVGEAFKRYSDEAERRRNLEGGQAYANIHDATFPSGKIPVEGAFVFLIVGFVAGYGVRAVISQFRHAEARRHSRGFRHTPTASALLPPPSYEPSSRKSPKFQNQLDPRACCDDLSRRVPMFELDKPPSLRAGD